MAGTARRIKITYGKSANSKSAAKNMLKAFEAEFGDVINIVIRRNHADPATTQLRVGIEYFGDAVRLEDDEVWVGTPPPQPDKNTRQDAAPGEGPASATEWVEPAIEEVGHLLAELLVQDEQESEQLQNLESDTQNVFLISLIVAASTALLVIAPHFYSSLV
jgi:hypothetical protein